MTEESSTASRLCCHDNYRYDTNYTRKCSDVIVDTCYLFLFPDRCSGDRSAGNGSQCARPVRPGGLQTAPVARAIGAPECSRSSHQFLHDSHLHDKALQYSPHRICWLLAVHDDTERLPCLVGNDRFGDQPRRHHGGALSKSCTSGLEPEQTPRLDGVPGNGSGMDCIFHSQRSRGFPDKRRHRRSMLRVYDLEEPEGQTVLLRLEFCLFLSRHNLRLRVLLRAHSACHPSPDKSHGKPRCRRIWRRSKPVRSHSIQRDQNDGFGQRLLRHLVATYISCS